MGHWIHTDTFDSVNEVNNTILTIFSVVNLLYYYNKLTDNTNNTNNTSSGNAIKKNTNINKTNFDMIEGFEGGFLTQKNMDNIFRSKLCVSSLIQVVFLIILMAIFAYFMIHIYRKRNI